MLCLSEAIAEPLIAAHFVRISLADYPSEEAMMSLALAFARDQNAS
jgi:uroporphyrinogen-III synthase